MREETSIMATPNPISFPLDQMRQNARQISSLSDNLNHQLSNDMRTAIGNLTGVPAPVRTIVEALLQQLEKQLLHLVTEHSTLGTNLLRAADVAEMLDKDVSQGFNRHN
jgi:hypothetical protein